MTLALCGHTTMTHTKEDHLQTLKIAGQFVYLFVNKIHHGRLKQMSREIACKAKRENRFSVFTRALVKLDIMQSL